jgi:hypothetical protein
MTISDDIKNNVVSIFNLNMETSEGGHALSLLIYYNDNTYHIFLINSGFGIDHFKSNKDRKDNKMLVPFDYFVISS